MEIPAASAPAENAPTGWDALAKETDAPAGTSAPIEAPTEAPAEAPAVVHLDVTQLDDGRIQIDAIALEADRARGVVEVAPRQRHADAPSVRGQIRELARRGGVIDRI